ncbi:carbohydrate ABC transporter permease [Kribbella sp. NPDC026611]|uniref:carbohydrate ABC transporter permease n=1 Tax=Kribbella sp. NPDC026611 TaxID=3154911 RepID=UPI0033C5A6EA
MTTSLRTRILLALVGLVVLFWTLAPLYWGVVVSLTTPADALKVPISLVPEHLTLDNYREVIAGTGATAGFRRAIFNSFVQSVLVTVTTLAVCVPAAYAFARIRFRGAGPALALITITMTLPVYLVLIPLFQLATSTGQVNTVRIVVAVIVSGMIPISIWILRSHIATIPVEIEEAARIDGAGTWTVLVRVIGPLIAPGIVATGVIIFLGSWGEFLIPAVFANSPDAQPLTVLIPNLTTKTSAKFGLQAAAGLIGLVPPLTLVVIFQRYLLAGLLRGATR